MHAIRFILLLVHRFHKTGHLHGIHSDSCPGVCTETSSVLALERSIYHRSEMIALMCFCVRLFTLPFKSKIRLEAENAILRRQLIVLARKIRGRVPWGQKIETVAEPWGRSRQRRSTAGAPDMSLPSVIVTNST